MNEQIGGVEIDLVKLYELVQKYGGMKGTVGKEKKWVKIADSMKIPKQVNDWYRTECMYHFINTSFWPPVFNSLMTFYCTNTIFNAPLKEV